MLHSMCELMNGLHPKKKSPLMAQAYIIRGDLEEFIAAPEQLLSPNTPIEAHEAQHQSGLIPGEILNIFFRFFPKELPPKFTEGITLNGETSVVGVGIG
jgi:hypothetical protein